MLLQLVVCFLGVLTTVRAVDLSLDFTEDQDEENECYGTSVGFGYSGTRQFHYHNLRKRYQDCTYVHGNLEITNLDDPNVEYDVSFLRHIRYVTGYVLIGLVTEVPVISLPNLQVVRGNKTYAIKGEEYSFIVAVTSRTDLTSGLSQLHLSHLQEISNGKVMFSKNPLLCYVDTIDWVAIQRGREDGIVYGDQAYSRQCEHCNCKDKAMGCWGPGQDLCQSAPPHNCHVTCPHRCFGPGKADCCSPLCAVGCTGPQSTDCTVCKDFEVEGECISHCPPKSYAYFQKCVSYA